MALQIAKTLDFSGVCYGDTLLFRPQQKCGRPTDGARGENGRAERSRAITRPSDGAIGIDGVSFRA